MLAWVVRFLIKDFQIFLSLAKSWLTFFFLDHFWLPNSIFFSVILWGNYHKPWRFYIYWMNHSLQFFLDNQTIAVFLSCKGSLMLFNFNLVLSSSEEILFRVLTLHIHLSILASSLSNLITSSSLTSQVSLLYDIALRMYIEYNLPIAP